jgi:hypothetical protein
VLVARLCALEKEIRAGVGLLLLLLLLLRLLLQLLGGTARTLLGSRSTIRLSRGSVPGIFLLAASAVGTIASSTARTCVREWCWCCKIHEYMNTGGHLHGKLLSSTLPNRET